MKDASAVVERYLLKYSLMKPLQEYLDMKKAQKQESKRKSDMLTFGGFAPEDPLDDSGDEKTSLKTGMLSSLYGKGTSDKLNFQSSLNSDHGFSTKTLPPAKTVCCCQLKKKLGGGKGSQEELACFTGAGPAPPEPPRPLQKPFEVKKEPPVVTWRYILLSVKANKKRLPEKQMGYVCTALNMASSKTVNVVLHTKLVDETDIKGIRAVLKQHVQLDPQEVQIFI